MRQGGDTFVPENERVMEKLQYQGIDWQRAQLLKELEMMDVDGDAWVDRNEVDNYLRKKVSWFILRLALITIRNWLKRSLETLMSTMMVCPLLIIQVNRDAGKRTSQRRTFSFSSFWKCAEINAFKKLWLTKRKQKCMLIAQKLRKYVV